MAFSTNIGKSAYFIQSSWVLPTKKLVVDEELFH